VSPTLVDACQLIVDADTYAAFIRLVRSRIQDLGITFETVDSMCGWPSRYCATIMCGNKALGVHNLFVLCSALALTPVFAHNGDDLARLRQHSQWIRLERGGAYYRRNQKRTVRLGKPQIKLCRDLWAISGRRGGMASARKLTAKQRSNRARKAVANRKWRPVGGTIKAS
jgi:hypothetical protein